METNNAPMTSEKANLSEAENGHTGVMSKTGDVAPEVTMESFAHLDEKKILRKVGDCPLPRAPFPRRR
jgi:hypothetical protein